MMESDDSAEVAGAWRALFGGEGSARSEKCLTRLCRYYNQPHRKWHTLRHIAEMLRFVAAHPDGGKPEQQIDVLFHDVIYDPQSRTNEEDSAAFRDDVLAQLGNRFASRPPEEDAILATKTHQSENSVVQVVLDADLEVFSRPWNDYLVYAQAIREEYSYVEEEAFRAGRAAILEKFLARPTLYFTQTMKGQREEAARENLRREIALLRG